MQYRPEELLFKLKEKDFDTFMHCMRVGQEMKEFGEYMGFPKDYVNRLYIAGVLHDVGKLAIPDEILNKPGKLTDKEFHVIQSHPTKGVALLKGYHPVIKNVAVGHHLSYTGQRGYPSNNISGQQIPYEARIAGVCDVYDALSSKRAYKEPIPQAKVFEMLKSDEKLDHSIVKEFIQFKKEQTRTQEKSEQTSEKQQQMVRKPQPQRQMCCGMER